MKLETKLLIYLGCFAFVDIIIPVPITAIILIYAVLSKPPWFKEMVMKLYS